MNKLAKYAVLVAGVIGIAGFFLPLLSVEYRAFTGSFSTSALVGGIDDVGDHFEGVSADALETPEARRAIDELNKGLEKARMVFVAMYVPSALLLLLGILAIAIRRFGRGVAVVALLSALAALGIYALFLGLLSELGKDDVAAAAGLGAHLIAVSGGIGVIFAIVGLVNPESGVKQVPHRHKATLASRPPQL